MAAAAAPIIIPTSPTPTPIPACAPVDNPGLALVTALEVGDGDEVEALVDTSAGLMLPTPDCVEAVEAGELELLEVDEVDMFALKVF